MYGTYIPKDFPQTWAQIRRSRLAKEDSNNIYCGIALIVIMFVALAY